VRRPAGRSQPSNGGLQRALRKPLQADCAQGPAAEAERVVGTERIQFNVMLLTCNVCSSACGVAQRVAETAQNHNGALTIATNAVAVAPRGAWGTTGPKRSVVKGQEYLADLRSSTEEGRDDRAMPGWAQRKASVPV
jgi:hypothetical protein